LLPYLVCLFFSTRTLSRETRHQNGNQNEHADPLQFNLRHSETCIRAKHGIVKHDRRTEGAQHCGAEAEKSRNENKGKNKKNKRGFGRMSGESEEIEQERGGAASAEPYQATRSDQRGSNR